MLSEPLADPDTTSVESLVAHYGEALEDAFASADRESLRDRGVDDATVEAIEAGEYGGITVEQAASVLTESADAPPADVIQAEVQDQLLVGMANAILDVDALAAELDGDLTPRDIQQRVEGRAPMRLDTYAAIRHVIASN
jgi:hypothetical protein